MKWIPDQKWFAHGFVGLVVFGAVLVLAHFGIVVAPDEALALILVLSLAVHYLVPPSLQDKLKRLDDDVVQIGVELGKLSPTSAPPMPPRGPPASAQPPS